MQYITLGENSLIPRPAGSSGQSSPSHIGRTNLMADLTWADLYARQIRKDLKQLAPAIRKVSNSTELVGNTAKLREQLQGAHRTIAELRTMAGSEPRRSNSK